MKDLTKTELVELLAAVYFRVLGFSHALNAVRELVMTLLRHYATASLDTSHTTHMAAYNLLSNLAEFFGIGFQVGLAILFLWKAPILGRLVTKGLSKALDFQPVTPAS